jgi:hypothetical protein
MKLKHYLMALNLLLVTQARAGLKTHISTYKESLSFELAPESSNLAKYFRINYSAYRLYKGLWGLGWCSFIEAKIIVTKKRQYLLETCDGVKQVFPQPIGLLKMAIQLPTDEQLIFERQGKKWVLVEVYLFKREILRLVYTPQKIIFFSEGTMIGDATLSLGKVHALRMHHEPLFFKFQNEHLSGLQNSSHSYSFSYNLKGEIAELKSAISLTRDVSSTKNPIRIAIIDTGVDEISKSELGGKIAGFNLIDPRKSFEDEHGHGSHVLNLIRQSAQQTPLEFLVLKYYAAKSSGKDNFLRTLKAFEIAINEGVHIINFSGGGPTANSEELELLQLAQKKGIIVVAASGNFGQSLDEEGFYPAGYDLDNIISVGSLNASESDLAETSNWSSKKVDVLAPGQEQIARGLNGIQQKMSGTSQAAAKITGLAARIWWHEPYLDYTLVKARLQWASIQSPALKNKVKEGSIIPSQLLNRNWYQAPNKQRSHTIHLFKIPSPTN